MKRYINYFYLSFLFSSFLYAQDFQFEWEKPVNGYIFYLGDIDGDDVGEFLNRTNPSEILSGIDGSLKYTLGANVYIANVPLLAQYNTKHFDFDFNSNGVKDFYEQDSYIMRIIDPSTNEIIFEYQGILSTISVRWIGDFDNDGIVEICFDDYDNSTNSGKAVVYSTGINLSSLEDGEKYLPVNFNLYQNYPNPFNPTTTIEYELNEFENVELKIYDSLGALVKVLVNQKQQKGKFKVIWDGRDERNSIVSTGVYLYELIVGNNPTTKKMILLK